MKHLCTIFIFVLSLFLITVPVLCQEDREKNLPEINPKQIPKIVTMFPENNAKNVDPNIPQVYLTFDIPMGNGRAWAQRDNNTALDHDEKNEVFWTADKLTCVAPVRLQPNKKYEILLNFKPFIGFASLTGIPSKPVFYTFETGTNTIDPKKREQLSKKLYEKTKPEAEKRGWSPQQATGQPDAYRYKTGCDCQLSWASLSEDDETEWLELTWDTEIEAVGVDVYETFNPGALNRVVAFDANNKEIADWKGTDPTPKDTPKGKGISKIRFDKTVKTAKVWLYLDSPKFPGWNEIDAVGLVDSAEKIHWATGADASSTYADK
ncbi:MAG: hypothetical protein LBC20_14390 [Planctomycetaceae bacterium]|jgi:hypothetical protein|nr:hypothetical protein [Planctomycetaceae bacterium]